MKKNVVYFINIIFIIIGCEESVNSENTLFSRGSISGSVTFKNLDQWPNDGYITISLNKNWPSENITGPPAKFSRIDFSNIEDSLYNYSFSDVPFKTYPAIAVSWRDPNNDDAETNQYIIGAYGGTLGANFDDADSIAISIDNPNINNINFSVYLDLLN